LSNRDMVDYAVDPIVYCTGFNGDGSDTLRVPHGEPYVGKLHVAPLLCYGVTGRFDES